MLIDPLIILVLALVVLVPGAPVALLLGKRLTLRWFELVPTAAAATMLLWTPVLIVGLAAGFDVRARLAMMAVISAALWVVMLREWRSWPANGWFGMWAGWGHLDSVLVALALVAVGMAYLLGGSMSADALYHAAQSLKLASLDDPSFSNTMSFRDQDIHPGYIVPVWHDMLGATSLAFDRNVVQVMYVGGAAVAPIALLAFAMLGRRLWPRRESMALVGGGIYLLAALSTETSLFPLLQAVYPREVATDIALPVLLAGLAIAVTPVSGPLHAMTTPADRRRIARTWIWGSALAAIGLVDVLMLHNSYVYIAGLLVGGLLLGRLVAGRAAATNSVKVAAVLTVVALVGTAVQYPVISRLAAFDQASAAAEATQTAPGADLLEGVRIGELLVGTADSFRLRTDHVVSHGVVPVLALLGALAGWVLLAARRAREPGVWLAAGTCLLLLLLTQVPVVFTEFVRIIGISQAKRAFVAMPLIAGVGTLWMVGLWTIWYLRSRPALLAVKVVGLGAMLVAIGMTMRTNLFVSEPRIPERAIQAIGLVLALVAIAAIARGVLDLVRRRPIVQRELLPESTTIDGWWGGVAAMTALALCAVTPVAWHAWTGTDGRRAARTGSALEQKKLRDLRSVAPELRRHEGELLLASPDLSHASMSLAPIYVVGSIAGHNANTKRNRVYEREERAHSFFLPGLDDDERFELLDDEQPDLVLVYSAGKANPALGFVRQHPGSFERLHAGSWGGLSLYRFLPDGSRQARR